MFFNLYPYTNFHELNLDMILGLMKKLHAEWNEFTAVNKITNAGAWDITKQYQAWTVVSDNNVGYISLQPVPAGVAITNTDYWGVIADYDILITDLSNRISALENDIKKLNKRIVFIGDSYGELPDNFIDKAISRSNIKYGVNISAGSYGFLGDKLNFPLDDYSFETLLDTNFSSIDDPGTITDVYVFGGINDAYLVNEGALLTAVENFCDYCALNLPKAHITIFLSSWTTSNTWLSNLEKVATVYSNGANKKGATFVLGISTSFHRKSLMRDQVHPTSAGFDYLAGAVVDFINSGHYEYYERYTGFSTSLVTNGTIDTADSEYRAPIITMTERDINISGCLVVNKDNYSRADWINIMFRQILDISANDVLIGNSATDYHPSMGYTKIIASNDNAQIQPGSAIIQNGKLYWASGCDSIDTQMDGKKVYLKYNITMPTAFN